PAFVRCSRPRWTSRVIWLRTADGWYPCRPRTAVTTGPGTAEARSEPKAEMMSKAPRVSRYRGRSATSALRFGRNCPACCSRSYCAEYHIGSNAEAHHGTAGAVGRPGELLSVGGLR